jgi:cytochrome c oxidase cbb3-type subunit 1
MALNNDMKSELTPCDSASRCPLMVLLVSGVLWLVVSGVLGLLASVQLHSPSFLSGCAYLTYGRLSVLAETAFVYGWLANAGLAVALWMLGRLAGEPLRGQNWAIGGALFWNLGVTCALVGVASGYATGFSLLGLPASVQLILLFSYAAIAVPGLLAWSGRLREVSFASHWYAAAALFIFPWILSIAHVMLFATPVRGVLQPIVAGWYAQAAWTLWLAPLALSAAYYVVPKVTGKVLPSYEFASLGFWCLVFVGGLTGGRHLLGGPVPAWIPSVAVVACALLLFHTCIVLLNLRGAFSGKGTALKFIAFGLAAYGVGALVDTATSFHAVAVHTQFTYFDEAQKQVALYAAASMLLFGGIYFAVPRITGKAWYSGALVSAHLVLSVAGLILFIGGLAVASLLQSQDLLESSVPFADIARHTRPWIQAATAGRGILLLANLAFLANFYLTSCRILNVSQPASFAPPSAMETPAS